MRAGAKDPDTRRRLEKWGIILIDTMNYPFYGHRVTARDAGIPGAFEFSPRARLVIHVRARAKGWDTRASRSLRIEVSGRRRGRGSGVLSPNVYVSVSVLVDI